MVQLFYNPKKAASAAASAARTMPPPERSCPASTTTTTSSTTSRNRTPPRSEPPAVKKKKKKSPPLSRLQRAVLARGLQKHEQKTTASEVQTSTPPVFFMIGSQRSGSNWLRTMLAGREDVIAPHPPHILRDFMPILPKYGNLENMPNLKVRFTKGGIKEAASILYRYTKIPLVTYCPILIPTTIFFSCRHWLTMSAHLSREIKFHGLTYMEDQ